MLQPRQALRPQSVNVMAANHKADPLASANCIANHNAHLNEADWSGDCGGVRSRPPFMPRPKGDAPSRQANSLGPAAMMAAGFLPSCMAPVAWSPYRRFLASHVLLLSANSAASPCADPPTTDAASSARRDDVAGEEDALARLVSINAQALAVLLAERKHAAGNSGVGTAANVRRDADDLIREAYATRDGLPIPRPAAALRPRRPDADRPDVSPSSSGAATMMDWFTALV